MRRGKWHFFAPLYLRGEAEAKKNLWAFRDKGRLMGRITFRLKKHFGELGGPDTIIFPNNSFLLQGDLASGIFPQL